MPEINGKQVIFRDTLPASIWWPLMPKLAEAEKSANPIAVLDLPTICQMIAGSVKSWEFAGEPSDPEAVGALDTFTELAPLIKMVTQRITERAPSGEAESEPTSR